MRAWVLVALVACGGAPPISDTNRLDKHEEILQRWSEIRTWRRDAGLPLDPNPQLVSQMSSTTAQAQKRLCPDNHDVPATCNQVCNLSDAICDDAEQICKIADELGKDDDFAQTKCNDAKASCRESKQRCCGCTP